jgi:hypothetical protein
MSASIPSGWETIAREIASAVLDTGTEGYFTISIENDVYLDLYIQGTWNSNEEIWIEISPTEDGADRVAQKLIALGWNKPNDDIPNYWKELSWDENNVAEIAAEFTQAINLFGITADDCELQVSIETEK